MAKEKKKKIKLTDAIKALDTGLDERNHSKHKRVINIEKKKQRTIEEERKKRFSKSMHKFEFLEVEDEQS